METCPSCGAEVSHGVASCPACGARLEGATASFKPVGVPNVPLKKTSSVGAEGPVLVVHKGAETGERFYLEDGEYKVGRDPANDIFLNDVTVSRHHARITVADGVTTVHDVGSLNGTYVNDALVDEAELHDGDALQVGRFKMLFFSAGGD